MDEQTDLKIRLMNELEGIIDRLLMNKPVPEEITLQYAEKAAVAVGEKVKAVIAQELLDDQRARPQEVACPGCGKRLRMKDYRRRRVVTEAGEVGVRRAYYYCADCKQGIFPPG
jgi:uncharacterized protein with PIN domain